MKSASLTLSRHSLSGLDDNDDDHDDHHDDHHDSDDENDKNTLPDPSVGH